MFKQIKSLITDNDPRPLHRIPFLIMWVASYAVATVAMFIVATLFSDLISYEANDWLYWNAPVLIGISVGGLLGVIGSLIQTWIVRRRYGFVPEYWRAATIIGAIVAGILLFAYPDMWGGNESFLPVILIIALGANLGQAIVLYRVNKGAWLMVAVAVLAAVIASVIMWLDPYYYNTVTYALFSFAVLHSIPTGIVIMRLMANPREGSIPKRDTEKAKSRMRDGLHPTTFMGFWMAAHLMGWVVLITVMFIWFMLFDDAHWLINLNSWLDANNLGVAIGVVWGSIVGLTIAIAQPWLMKQHSNAEIPHWIKFSVVGWAIAGIGFWVYIESYYYSDIAWYIALGVCFITPTLFQTIPMWRSIRGGWIWAFTGVVTAVIAILIHNSASGTYNETMYAIFLGAIVQSIITGVTFLTLKTQQQTDQFQTEVAMG